MTDNIEALIAEARKRGDRGTGLIDRLADALEAESAGRDMERVALQNAMDRISQTIAYVRASWLGTGEPVRNTPAGEIIAILQGERTFEEEGAEA